MDREPKVIDLARDGIAKVRWSTDTPSGIDPPMQYLGQAQGQTLLQAVGGIPFRVGTRDSNGGLLPGVADIAQDGNVSRVGGTPRVLETIAETVPLPLDIYLLIERWRIVPPNEATAQTRARDLFIKHNNDRLRFLATIPQLVPRTNEEFGVFNVVFAAMIAVRPDLYLLQYEDFSSDGDTDDTLIQVYWVRQGRVERFETSSRISSGNTNPSYQYSQALAPYQSALIPRAFAEPDACDRLGIQGRSFSQTPYKEKIHNVNPSESILEQPSIGNMNELGWQQLLNPQLYGVVVGGLGSTPISTADRQTLSLTELDLAVMGISLETLIYLNSNIASLQQLKDGSALFNPSEIVLYEGVNTDTRSTRLQARAIRGINIERD